jgi:hypothetical protein
VPPERAAQVIGMLLGIEVSAGWVDRAAARVSAQLGKAGFEEAMLAALAGGDVLAADPEPAAGEDGQEKDPEEKEKPASGSPHVLITRTPDGRLTFLQAIGSRPHPGWISHYFGGRPDSLDRVHDDQSASGLRKRIIEAGVGESPGCHSNTSHRTRSRTAGSQ